MNSLYSINFKNKSSKTVIVFTLATLLVVHRVFKYKAKRKRCSEKHGVNQSKYQSLDGHFDVLIVGAGPAGSTSAFFSGQKNMRVALCDKKTFPRPKPCGDAWCKPALSILEEMNVLEKMRADGIVQVVERGGFISPFGYECINTDGGKYGSVTGCQTYAIKRQLADEYLVRAAQKLPSVTLFEGLEVLDASFIAGENEKAGFWKVQTLSGNEIGVLNATCLLICDGSTSYLAQKLGIIPKGSQPEAVCSHAYVEGTSHKWKDADGVMIFNKSMLPGYSALFRHYNNDMYFGTYILPGGQATSRSIAPFESEAIQHHPYVKDAFGHEFKWAEKRVVAPIRLGGVKRCYGQQLLLVGDSAGHVDPLTGEGIHTAMVAAKIAAAVLHKMFHSNDFSSKPCKEYEKLCYTAFGYEFFYSSLAARIIYHFPIAVDALAVVGKRQGQAFLDFFGEVMTGVRPKSEFLRPGLLLEIFAEVFCQMFQQYVLRKEPLIPQSIGMAPKKLHDKNVEK